MEEKEEIVAAAAIANALRERLDQHNENRRIAQEDLESACDRFRKQADETEEGTSRELEEKLDKESSRLQGVLDDLYQNRDCPEKIQEAIQKAGTVLATKWLCFIKKEESNTYLTNTVTLDNASEEAAHDHQGQRRGHRGSEQKTR